MDKVKTIIDKEWAEVFKNRLVLFTVLFLPLLFTAMALGVMISTSNAEVAAATSTDMPARYCQGVEGAGCLDRFLATQFMLMFMMIPVIIPVTIAAYSVVGEKSTRSLEPLLATPVSTVELLSGKALAAIIPALAATWLGFAIYLLGVWLVGGGELFRFLLEPLWMLAIFLVGPLLALLSVCFALMVSSRVTDPRAAEQLSAVVVIPLVLLVMGQAAGLFALDEQLVLLFAGILLLLDAILVYLAVQVFQREAILTKWR